MKYWCDFCRRETEHRRVAFGKDKSFVTLQCQVCQPQFGTDQEYVDDKETGEKHSPKAA